MTNNNWSKKLQNINGKRLISRLSKYLFYFLITIIIIRLTDNYYSLLIFVFALVCFFAIDYLFGKYIFKKFTSEKLINICPASKTSDNIKQIKKDKLGHWTIKKITGKNFKILQFSDIHIGNGIISFKRDRMALSAIKKLVEHTRPDLIIITGDIVYPVPFFTGSGNNLQGTELFASFMNSLKIPWTITYGNHDEEIYSWYSLETLSKVYEKFNYCLFKKGPNDISGLSNHIINIINHDDSLNTSLIMLDSNSYINPLWIIHYDHVHKDQVKWYAEQLTAISSFYNSKSIVSSLVFCHIPLNEYLTAWGIYKKDENNPDIIYHFGQKTEKISAPLFRNPLFKKILEMGSTKGIFVGHDHYNDFSITYKGIRLTYGKSIDYIAYPKILRSTWQRGSTLIELDENSNFTVKPIVLSDI